MVALCRVSVRSPGVVAVNRGRFWRISPIEQPTRIVEEPAAPKRRVAPSVRFMPAPAVDTGVAIRRHARHPASDYRCTTPG
jgi:hypothetical protein